MPQTLARAVVARRLRLAHVRRGPERHRVPERLVPHHLDADLGLGDHLCQQAVHVLDGAGLGHLVVRAAEEEDLFFGSVEWSRVRFKWWVGRMCVCVWVGVCARARMQE